MRTRVLALIACALPLACGGDSTPHYALQTVMLEVESITKRLEGAILTPGGSAQVEEHALSIRRWLDDSAVERYLARTDLLGTREQFAELEQAFDGTLDEVILAAGAGDEDRARAAYPLLRAGCDRCHAVFRPDLK